MKVFNVLLLYPEPNELKSCRFGFSLNLLYLAALLERENFNPLYLDYSLEKFDQNLFFKILNTVDVVIVEFDAFALKRSVNIANGEVLTDLIRISHPNIKIIGFGHDLALYPRVLPNTDYTFLGEAESGIIEVVNCLLAGNLPPLHTSFTSPTCLDWLPYPSRHLLSPRIETGGTIHKNPHLAKSTLIQTSRGCLHSCSFCQRQGWYGRYRTNSVSYAVREFKEIYSQGYSNVWITDDNFCFHLSRAKDLLRSLCKEISNPSWRLALSTWSRIDRETIDLFRNAGVSIISIGIESVDPHICEFYNKRIDLDHVSDIVEYADSVGIYCVGNFIIGAPMETEDTIANSLSFAKSLPFDQVNVKILDYMIGSKLYDLLPNALSLQDRHHFACRENELCIFPLDSLRTIANNFKASVEESRKSSLLRKIQKFGPPYIPYPHK